MSNINIAIRMRPISENKSKKEVQWSVANNNTIHSVKTSNPYNFTFEHIFSAEKSNYDVYSSIVNPVVKSCLNGYNGTVIIYGQTSSGKNYSMMGNDEDRGIQLLAIEQLFEREDMSSDMEFKIRVGYIEIYKENIYDLLDARKRVKVDPNGRFDGKEVPVNNYEETNKLLLQGTKQRQQSNTNKNKLSSKSHAIFRLTIESKDKANGAVQTSYLKFVYVTGSDLVSGALSLDSQLEKENDSNISLLWLNVVVNELSEGKTDINFGKSKLTQLIHESLTHDSTAFICNIRTDVVDETISTLKFATQAKKVQILPMPNSICETPIQIKAEFSNFGRKRECEMEIIADYPCKRVRTCSTSTELKCESVFDSSDSSTESFENQLKEIADVKVKNSLLIKELAEVKAARESDKKWFEEKMIAATLAEGKLELLREEKSDKINELQQEIKNYRTSSEVLNAQVKNNGNTINELQQEIEKYMTSKEELLVQVEALRKKNQVRNDWINVLQEENSQLKNKPMGENKVLSAMRDDIQMLKESMQSKKLETEPSIGYTESEDVDAPAPPLIMIEADCYIGCVMGKNGETKKAIENATGAKIQIFGDRIPLNPRTLRKIKITGTEGSVNRAKDEIVQRIGYQKKMEERRQSGYILGKF